MDLNSWQLCGRQSLETRGLGSVCKQNLIPKNILLLPMFVSGILDYYLLQLLFSACVAAVKSRPVLHYCVVIFFWSSGIMECTCMLFTFENGVPLMR